MKRVLRGMLLALASAVLVLLFYVAVVMGQDLADVNGAARETGAQALPAPLEQVIELNSEEEIRSLAEIFPAPVMYAGGKTLTFTGGSCEDVPFEDGVARVVTLTYRTEDFDTLTLQSIYPARAVSLLEQEGYTFTGMTTDKMVGLHYVAMQSAINIRLHAQGDEALYVLTLPAARSDMVEQWTDDLQLYRGITE